MPIKYYSIYVKNFTITIKKSWPINDLNILMSRAMKVRAALTLTKARDNIDDSLVKIKDYLESTGLGYKTPLVDKEGFPLPDIDHYKILSERQHAARLLNDRKRLEFIIDCLAQTEGDPTGTGRPLYLDLEETNPFAIIDEVFADSPAEKCGLLNGDFIIQFGKAKSFYEVPKEIIEDTPVIVKVFRILSHEKSIVDVTITPTRWSGKGLIGCHIQPFAE